MAEEIVEVPIDEPQETAQERGLSSGLTPEASAPEGEAAPAEIAQEAVPKAKARGRPKGVKDAKPRAETRARAPHPQPAARIPANPPSDSESSLDEATLHETTLMHIMRGVQQYRHTQKNQKSALYASWFGR